MSLKSEIWVQALLRRCNAEGLFAAVVKRGAAEAGAVFVIIDKCDGSYRLLGPAPGPAYDAAGERLFVDEMQQQSTLQDVEALLARRQRFDDDIWIVEIQDRSGSAGLAVTK